MFLSTVSIITALLPVGGMIGTGAELKDRPKGTTVTGRVVSEPGGKEVAGVVVTLWNGSGGQRRTSQTDDAGVYSFANVEPGEHYKVWIQERPKTEAGIWSEGVVVRVKDRPVRADDLFRTCRRVFPGWLSTRIRENPCLVQTLTSPPLTTIEMASGLIAMDAIVCS